MGKHAILSQVGNMYLKIRGLVALIEDPHWIPSTYMGAYNGLYLQF